MSIDTLEYVKKLESEETSAGSRGASSKTLDEMIGGLEQATRADFARLEQKFDNTVQRIEATVWKAAFAVLGGGLAIGGFLIRFLR